jgi:coenzyme F420-0:L-glutamate ligase / coenzyme F420-1:gamma-L-glutamate ligase
MTDLSDAIKQRRSIRKYQTRKVPQKLIKDVLGSADWAPSAHNAQPWRFIILADLAIKRELSLAMAEAWTEDMIKDGNFDEAKKLDSRIEKFANAPALIVACLTMDGFRKFLDEKRQRCERDLAVQSLGASIQNLLLAAHSAGLGACWFAAPGFCKETVRKVLKIPDDVEPQALVTLGYPAEKPSAPTKKPLADVCFVDKWGEKLR